jgi:hypothetical protein
MFTSTIEIKISLRGNKVERKKICMFLI